MLPAALTTSSTYCDSADSDEVLRPTSAHGGFVADGLQPLVINNEVTKGRCPAGLLTGACLGQGLPVEQLNAPTKLETEREGEREGEREREKKKTANMQTI